MNKNDFLLMIELIEQLSDLQNNCLEHATPDPLVNMSLFLMKRHLQGKLVTPTSLAGAAQVPYTTATRRVAEMRKDGLLTFRPRSKSGRSFSVHPSKKLIDRIQSLALKTEQSLRHFAAPDTHVSENPARIIPPPAVARQALGLGTGLDILLARDPVYSISKGMKRELSYLMGGRVRFHDASIDELRGEALRNAGEPRSKYDIIAVDLPMIGEYAAKKVLMPLDQLEGDGTISRVDFHSPAWRSTLSGDAQYAIPILINPEVLFYRSDLFRNQCIEPPQDTAELISAAQKLQAPGRGFYGVSWTAARGAPAGQAFVQFLADFGQPVLDLEPAIDGFKTSNLSSRPLKPTIDTPRGHATAHFMKTLLTLSPPEVLEMSWGDQVSFLREGRVAMAYEWASRVGELPASANKGELGFLPHPVGDTQLDKRPRQPIAPIGGFALGIPANISPSRIEVAWRTIEWLASPEIVKMLVQQSGHVSPRFSVAADPDVRRLSPVTVAVEKMAKDGHIRLWPRVPVASFTEIVAILGEEIHDMLSGVHSVERALRQAQSRSEDLLS